MMIAGISLVLAAPQPILSPGEVALVSPPEITTEPADIDPTCLEPFAKPEKFPADPAPNCNAGNWVRTSDYTSEAIRNNWEGAVHFTLTIDRDGTPTDCEVTASDVPQLDEYTCGLLMRRARFVPAFAASGEAVEGTYSAAVRWEIPENHGRIDVPAPEFWIVTYTVEKDGSVSDCTIEKSEPRQIAENFCEQLPAFNPELDENGEPMRSKVRVMHRLAHEAVPQ